MTPGSTSTTCTPKGASSIRSASEAASNLELLPGLLVGNGLHRTKDEDPVDRGGVGHLQDDRTHTGVLGGKGRAIIRPAPGREDDVTGVGEASDGGPARSRPTRRSS